MEDVKMILKDLGINKSDIRKLLVALFVFGSIFETSLYFMKELCNALIQLGKVTGFI